MEMNRQVARGLLSISAVFLRPQEPFTWASGIKSPIYCDNRLILTAPEVRTLVENAIADTVKREFPEAEVLMGTATAGIAHAAIAAHLLGMPMGYVRSGSKDHGRKNQIEGRLEKGQKVVVIEDLISTAGSALDAVEALRAAGAEVLGVYEAKPTPSGLTRNLHQCLHDFNIPLHLSHTVTRVFGQDRLSAVEIMQVDEGMNPIPGTAQRVECDALILSVGLIPENELAEGLGVVIDPKTKGPLCDAGLMTSVPGVFSCGNALHVNDLVDYVSQEAETAGKNAAAYIKEGKTADAKTVEILPVDGVRYTVPKYIRPTEMEDTLTVRFRVGDVYKNCAIATYFDDELISKRKRPVMAPGEMEQVILQKSKLADYPDLKHITIKIEEA